MSARLRIASPDDAPAALKLVEACHAETGHDPDPDARASALEALLGGGVPGAFYLIGPPSAPVGYAALSFGHSLSRGGTEAHLDELYIRPRVRRRGMASEAVIALSKMLSANGVIALTVRAPEEAGFLTRLRFRPEGGQRLGRSLV